MAETQDRLVTKLGELAAQYAALDERLADPAVAADHEQVRELSVKRAALADVVKKFARWQRAAEQIREHEQIVAEAADAEAGDAELVELAQAELPELRARAEELLQAASDELVTADDRAVNKVILEIRAGTGGAEAALWAGDLLEMYQKYAGLGRWRFELLEISSGDQGGVRQAVISVRGRGVWQGLGYESGVHCVKRVPATETQGRIHTSTATAAVLPEPEQLEIEIPESEVETHVTTAQGPGGQNVNKVATAVHLVHKPTGIEVRMQESKSQYQNRERAWQLLRARVYDHFQRQKQAQRAEARAQMIGTGGRSERIRTYRFKDNIAVDHRLGESFNLQTILAGELGAMVEKLIAQDRAMRLAAL